MFLIGRHGSGKTSIGHALEAGHGWKHISLGDLGRLARKNQRPQEHSLRLMVALSRHRPGEPLAGALVQAILADIERIRSTQCLSVDGFPSEAAHLALLTAGSCIILVDATDETRETRLARRAELTNRQWTPGMASARDLALPDLIQAAASAGVLSVVSNTGDLAAAVAAVLDIAGQKKPPCDGWLFVTRPRG